MDGTRCCAALLRADHLAGMPQSTRLKALRNGRTSADGTRSCGALLRADHLAGMPQSMRIKSCGTGGSLCGRTRRCTALLRADHLAGMPQSMRLKALRNGGPLRTGHGAAGELRRFAPDGPSLRKHRSGYRRRGNLFCAFYPPALIPAAERRSFAAGNAGKTQARGKNGQDRIGNAGIPVGIFEGWTVKPPGF